MSRSRLALTAHLPTVLLVLTVAGCSSSSTEPEPTEFPNFEGSYVLSGTYFGRPGNSVEGSLVISDQVGTSATAAMVFRLSDHGNTSFVLNMTSDVAAATAGPVTAQLAADGSISFSFSGREEIFGIDPADCCNFTIALAGKLGGNLVSGDWVLTRDMPSEDRGSFSALR